MGTLGWILTVIGTLGIAGTIALAIFAPLLAQALLKGAIALLEAILSTRIGCAALAGVVCFVVGNLIGDQSGASRIQAEWDAAKIEFAEQLTELTQKVDTHAREQSERARADEERASREQSDRIEAYTAALPRSGSSCDGITDRELDLARGVQNDRPGKRRWLKARNRDQ